MSFYTFVYFLGIASCGMQGAEKIMKPYKWTTPYLLCAGINSFGGGFIRDVFLLSVFPAVFTSECVPDIMVAVIAALVYVSAHQSYPVAVKWFTILADACGLGTFIAIGVDKATNLGYSAPVAILSGIITSQGGGILATIFCGTPILQAVSANPTYRVMGIIGTALYSHWIGSAVNPVSAQYAVVLYTTIGALISENMFRNELRHRTLLVVDNKLLCSAFGDIGNSCVMSPPCEHVLWFYKQSNQPVALMVLNFRKRTILYHCMRLM